jgi:hypothetical protein
MWLHPFCEINVLILWYLILFGAVLSIHMLQNAGGFQSPGAAKPDDLAAIQVVPGSPDWILAKVITHDPQTDMYKLSDEDVESSKSK